MNIIKIITSFITKTDSKKSNTNNNNQENSNNEISNTSTNLPAKNDLPITSTSITPFSNNNLNSLIANIPNEILNLLWFSDGPLKNYDPTILAQSESDIYGIKIKITLTGPKEPSSISNLNEIGLPLKNPPKLDYFPSYEGMTPDERATYLSWLSNIEQPIDIGYVFVFYYGLERFLYFDESKYESAFNTILKLRTFHHNHSFYGYSTDALYAAAIIHNRTDLVQLLLDLNKDSTSIIHLDCMANISQPLSINQIINITSDVGFTNKRYIKLQPQLFIDTLKENLFEKYSMIGFPLSKEFLYNCSTTQLPITANISIEPRWFDIPNVLTNKTLQSDLLNILLKTHNDVKQKLKEQRKNK